MTAQRVMYVEGVVYDPTLDSGRKAVLTDKGEYVYVEDDLVEGQRVRITIEVLESVAEVLASRPA